MDYRSAAQLHQRLPAAPELLDRLELPLMVPNNQDSLRTAYTISVDASTGIGTFADAHHFAVISIADLISYLS